MKQKLPNVDLERSLKEGGMSGMPNINLKWDGNLVIILICKTAIFFTLKILLVLNCGQTGL